jgi:hypothetical protein
MFSKRRADPSGMQITGFLIVLSLETLDYRFLLSLARRRLLLEESASGNPYFAVKSPVAGSLPRLDTVHLL